MNKKDLALMDDFIEVLVVSGAWQDILTTDPQICDADKVFLEHLDCLKERVSLQYALALEDLVTDYINTVSKAAILYGLHVADVIRTVSASPGELSQYILDRIAADREGLEE